MVTLTLQHITYLEWLPIVLGKTAMTQHTILPVTVGYSDRRVMDNVFSLSRHDLVTRDCELIKSPFVHAPINLDMTLL